MLGNYNCVKHITLCSDTGILKMNDCCVNDCNYLNFSREDTVNNMMIFVCHKYNQVIFKEYDDCPRKLDKCINNERAFK